MTEIKPVLVSQSVEYDPESYLEYCKENNEEPTQDGFIDYIQDWVADDFNNNYDVDVKVIM